MSPGVCVLKFDASRRGKKGLCPSRDKIEGPCALLAIKKKARAVVGSGGNNMLCGPGSKSRLGREKEK